MGQLTFGDLLREHYRTDRGPTMRELYEQRFAAEHEGIWANPIITPSPPERRGPTGDRKVFTSTVVLDRVAARNPAMVRTAKEHLAAKLDRFVDSQGYNVISVNVGAAPPRDATGQIELRLEAVVEPRHDGEWDDIRAAIEEDEADREQARLDNQANRTVNDRLDALASSVAVWAARNPAALREALRAPVGGS